MDTHSVRGSLPVATDTLGRRIVPRRHRTVEEKIRIVEESLQAGASAAEVARRYEINANLLFGWRRQHEQGLLRGHRRRTTAAKLVPVKMTGNSREPVTANGTIEIELAEGVRVRVVGEAGTHQIEAVLAALLTRAR